MPFNFHAVPDASYVAPYTKWRSMGRQVRKGEKAITIIAPHTYTETDDEEIPEIYKIIDDNNQDYNSLLEDIVNVVSEHIGLDTSEYSFGYVAGWSGDKKLPQLRDSLEIIRRTSDEIIADIDNVLIKKGAIAA